MVFFARNGQGTKLEGLATFLPSIGLDGKLTLSTRISNDIINRLNQVGAFKGEVENAENVGKTADELVTLWNTEHPDDQVA